MYSGPALRRLHLGVSIVVVTVTADASVEDDPLAADVRLLPAAVLATTLPERMIVVTETATAITTANVVTLVIDPALRILGINPPPAVQSRWSLPLNPTVTATATTVTIVIAAIMAPTVTTEKVCYSTPSE